MPKIMIRCPITGKNVGTGRSVTLRRTLVLTSENHGALTICLHAGGKPASVSGGFGLEGGGCKDDSLNQKSSS